jgi:hypothetical protein
VRRGDIESGLPDCRCPVDRLQHAVGAARKCSGGRTDSEEPAVGARLTIVERAPVVPMMVDQIRARVWSWSRTHPAAILLCAGTGLRHDEALRPTLDRSRLPAPGAEGGRSALDAPLGSGHAGVAEVETKLPDRGSEPGGSGRARGLHRLLRHRGRPSRLRPVLGTPSRPGHGGEVLAPNGRRCRPGRSNGRDLRHHHASLLLSRGVSPALVAEPLGHDLATLLKTLKTYAHVIRADEDRVRSIVDDALGDSTEDHLRTGAR